MNTRVNLTASQVQDCIDFAKLVDQSKIQFGGDEGRSNRELTADTLVGKVSELALQQFLEESFDFQIAVDFSHYGETQITDDGQDIGAFYHNGEFVQTSIAVNQPSQTTDESAGYCARRASAAMRAASTVG